MRRLCVGKLFFIARAIQTLKRKLRSFPALQLKARLDGRELSGDYVLLEVMNIQNVGPNLYLAPGADPGDGRLDVVVVADRERDKFCQFLSSWQSGELRTPDLRTYPCRRLQIDWNGFELHIDDKSWPDGNRSPDSNTTVIDVKLKRKALVFLAPQSGRPPQKDKP